MSGDYDKNRLAASQPIICPHFTNTTSHFGLNRRAGESLVDRQQQYGKVFVFGRYRRV
jgi:hypothetical protein